MLQDPDGAARALERFWTAVGKADDPREAAGATAGFGLSAPWL
ncbi:hypothetical protein OG800_16155 [Streptomyces sp. NBC_00445]